MLSLAKCLDDWKNGSGKSTILRIMQEFMQRRWKVQGKRLNHCLSIGTGFSQHQTGGNALLYGSILGHLRMLWKITPKV